jgi:hypothetical protein
MGRFATVKALLSATPPQAVLISPPSDMLEESVLRSTSGGTLSSAITGLDMLPLTPPPLGFPPSPPWPHPSHPSRLPQRPPTRWWPLERSSERHAHARAEREGERKEAGRERLCL